MSEHQTVNDYGLVQVVNQLQNLHKSHSEEDLSSSNEVVGESDVSPSNPKIKLKESNVANQPYAVISMG